jgi:hypothetical protein
LIEFPQALLPLRFEPAGDQPVFGFDGPITPFGLFGLVAGALDGQPPLREGGIVIGFELLRGE